MSDRPLWTVLSEVDQRAGDLALSLPLLSVSKLHGVVRYNELFPDRLIRADDLSHYKVVDPGQIVLNKMSAATGAVGRAEERGLVSPDYAVLSPSDDCDSRYLKYLLGSENFCKNRVEPRLQGIGIGDVSNARTPRVTMTSYLSIVSFLPKKQIQTEIAVSLDRETGEIDAMLAKLASLSESVSERRREIVRSILKSVGQTVRLGLVVDVVSGSGFPDRFQGISDEELPFYKVSSLSNVDRQVLTDSDNTVSREIADQLGARVIPSQSVVMAKIGAALLLARYALTARPSCIDNNMQALVPHQGVIISRFLAYAMEGVSIPSLVKPGPVPSLDVMGMKMSRIAYNPSLKEQCRIADHLDEVTGRIDAMLTTIDELKALLVERRAALITDVVTGRKKIPS